MGNVGILTELLQFATVCPPFIPTQGENVFNGPRELRELYPV
jgi:hypothetical protein